MRHLSVYTLLTLLCSILALTGCDSRQDAGEALLQNFGGSCMTHGRWTDQAIAQNRGLVNTLETLKNTDACKPFVSQLANIQGLSQGVNQTLSDQSYQDYRLSEERFQELTLALNTTAPSDTEMRNALGSELVRARVEMATSRAKYNVGMQSTNRDHFARSAQNIQGNMQSMLQDVEGLSTCLMQSPAAALSLGTQMVTMGGSFATPIIGTTLGVIGQIFNYSLAFTRNSSLVSNLWNSKKAQLPAALSCAMESMASLYCQAEDARDLIDIQANSYIQDESKHDAVFATLDLLNRRLPVFIEWLRNVRQGMIPNDVIEADRQNEIWLKVQSFDNLSREVVGKLNYNKRLYNSLSGKPNAEAQKETLIVTVIREFAWDMVGETSPFKLLTNDANRMACYISVGLTTPCPAIKPAILIDNYIRESLVASGQVNFEKILDNWKEIQTRVKGMIDIELSNTIMIDPAGLVTAAYEPTVDNVSPVEALRAISIFLKARASERVDYNPQIQSLLSETQTIVQTALYELSKPSDQSLGSITKVFDLFQLRVGIQFFTERMSKLLEWELTRRLNRGLYSKNATDILKTAGSDIREKLNSSGNTTLDAISTDIAKAQSLTQSNLENFHNYFHSALSDAIMELYKAAEESNEPKTGSRRPNYQLMAQLCSLMMTTDPTAKAFHVPYVCYAVQLESLYQSTGQVPALQFQQLSDEVKNQPFSKRVCSYYKFLRAGRLYEVLSAKRLRERELLDQTLPFGLPDSLKPTQILDTLRGINFIPPAKP